MIVYKQYWYQKNKFFCNQFDVCIFADFCVQESGFVKFFDINFVDLGADESGVADVLHSGFAFV